MTRAEQMQHSPAGRAVCAEMASMTHARTVSVTATSPWVGRDALRLTDPQRFNTLSQSSTSCITSQAKKAQKAQLSVTYKHARAQFYYQQREVWRRRTNESGAGLRTTNPDF